MATRTTYMLGGGWKGVLEAIGVDHLTILRQARLPEDLLSSDDPRVDADGYQRFADALDRSLPGGDFWTRLVDMIRPEFFSPPIFAALCSPDLATAARRLALFKPLIAPFDLDVHHDSSGLQLRYRWRAADISPPASLYAFEALFITRLARLGTRHEMRPLAVVIPALPRQPQPFEDAVGVPLRVGGDHTAVTFSPEDATRPFLTASSEMWRIFEPALRKRLADLEGEATVAERTRAVLLEAIPSGQVAVAVVARRLAMSPRTLQRRLTGEGTSFKAVLQDTRKSLAMHYLGRTRLTSTEIAFLLGFDEPTSFHRAFRRWTGGSPEALRRRLSASAGATSNRVGPRDRTMMSPTQSAAIA